MMIHSAPLAAIERGDVLEILKDLKHQGYIRAIGASVYGEDTAMAAINAGGYDCLQIAFSILDRRPEWRLLAAAQKADVGLVARSVLLKGALSSRYRHLPDSLAALKAKVEQMSGLVEGEPDRLPELAYRYVLSASWLQSALVGAGSVGELEAAVAFQEMGPLSADLLAGVRDVPMPDEFYLNPGNWPTS